MLALELVARLHNARLEFIFKGGTSFVLFFDPVRRLSVDVVLRCLESEERVQDQFQPRVLPLRGPPLWSAVARRRLRSGRHVALN